MFIPFLSSSNKINFNRFGLHEEIKCATIDEQWTKIKVAYPKLSNPHCSLTGAERSDLCFHLPELEP